MMLLAALLNLSEMCNLNDCSAWEGVDVIFLLLVLPLIGNEIGLLFKFDSPNS